MNLIEQIAVASDLRHRDGRNFVAERIYEQVVKPLETQLNALAAENAGLKQHVPDVRSAAMFEAIEKAEKIMDDGMPELAMVEAYSILRDSFETPATDRFIADAGIQALEQFAGEQDSRAKKYYEINPGCAAQYECQYAAGQAWYFAECIRKEAAQLRGEKAE